MLIVGLFLSKNVEKDLSLFWSEQEEEKCRFEILINVKDVGREKWIWGILKDFWQIK